MKTWHTRPGHLEVDVLCRIATVRKTDCISLNVAKILKRGNTCGDGHASTLLTIRLCPQELCKRPTLTVQQRDF